MLRDTVKNLSNIFDNQVKAAKSLQDLEEVRLNFLGKKGQITNALRSLGSCDLEVRKTLGLELNKLRDFVSQVLQERKECLEEESLLKKLSGEFEDLSLPTLKESEGRIHPITQVRDELITIFSKMGFVLHDGPEIETDFNNFTALNIDETHPARQSHDTFYMNAKDQEGLPLLLRTHMSTVQIRTMKEHGAPIRMISMGSCYRSDYDATHTPMFHQIEGLVIDRDINMSHMKWCLKEFLTSFFQVDNLNMRMRPSYFPFTEPSAEIDIECKRDKESLVIGNHGDWLEILGCGMVHPNVLKNAGIDPKEFQGFAFGCGIDRLAMLKYGIPDLRSFFESDKRWLEHYGFKSLDIPGVLLGGLS